MEGSVLVIGGGIAGIQTSLDLTDLGFKVYLVERNPSIGGRMAQFDRLFPANDCSLCVLAPQLVSVYRNSNIELFTLTEVKKVTGEPGNFTVTMIKKPRYIDETKCRGCGACIMACPEQNIKIVKGKAKIKGKLCKNCQACLDICPTNAIELVPVRAPDHIPEGEYKHDSFYL